MFSGSLLFTKSHGKYSQDRIITVLEGWRVPARESCHQKLSICQSNRLEITGLIHMFMKISIKKKQNFNLITPQTPKIQKYFYRKLLNINKLHIENEQTALSLRNLN